MVSLPIHALSGTPLLALPSMTLASPPENAAVDPDVLMAQRAAQGDRKAFQELVGRYQRRVFAVAVRMLGDAQEAEDLTQDVFVALHGALGSFRQESKLSTWIYRITRNHCLNRIKYLDRRGRKAQVRSSSLDEQEEDAVARLASPEPSPAKVMETSQDVGRLEAALHLLPAEQRLLVVLREVEQLSYEEMVEATGLPVGTIKSRLHRARTTILAALPDLGGTHGR